MTENEEILGYHLEQAHDYREGLGQRDASVDELAARAGGWLAAAGGRAERRSDVRAARGLLNRAIRLLPTGHPAYWQARLDLGTTLADAGELEAAASLLETIVGSPDDVPEETRLRSRLILAWVDSDRRVQSVDQEKRQVAEVIRQASRRGYHAVLSRAWLMAAGIYVNGVDVRRATRAFERADRFAVLAGEREAESDILLGLAALGTRSRMPISEVLALVDRALDLSSLSRGHKVKGDQTRAYLIALLGRFDEARELMTTGMRELEEQGRVEELMQAFVTLGLIEFFAERLPEARAHFTKSREIADRIGQPEWSAFTTARMAHLYMLDGMDDEALAAIAAVGDSDDPWYRMFVAGARARVMARRGQTAEAVAMARSMIVDAEAAGFAQYPVILAPALEDLAEVLAADGQSAEACAVLNRVVEMQRAKENVVGVAKAERALARVAAMSAD